MYIPIVVKKIKELMNSYITNPCIFVCEGKGGWLYMLIHVVLS